MLAAAERADVCFVVGTSAVVYPAALPEIARSHCALVVEVNPEVTELTPHMHLSLRGPASEILPQLVEMITAPSGI